MTKKMIFHYPGPFYDELNTGEKKRPLKMYDAFKQQGFDVYEITGTRPERSEKLNKLKQKQVHFQFLYSENSTLPLGLCGKRHLPTLSNPDYQLFKWAFQQKIPIGVYYRDLFWQYPPFKQQIGLLKYYISLPFYKSELKLYARYATKIFTPSNEFSQKLTKTCPYDYMALPPAEETHPHQNHSSDNHLNLIYVGSITPPKYNLTSLFQALSELPSNSVNLDLITRANEWHIYKSFYTIPGWVNIIHSHGNSLNPYYTKADIALLYFDSDEYMKLAMPLKLFEAIGYGLPIICYGDNAVSKFVLENNIGWVVNDGEDTSIFNFLLDNKEEIQQKRKQVLKIQKHHTWQARVQEVCNTLAP